MACATRGLGGRGDVRLNRIHRRCFRWQWWVAGRRESRQRDVGAQRRDVAEEPAFARKASGLVRGLSMGDAFGAGLLDWGLTPSIWVMTGLGVGVHFGANLTWATIVSVALAGIGFPLVRGALGGSMPRSGGEHVSWRNDAMQGPAVTALEVQSVFSYAKKARRVWGTPPYRNLEHHHHVDHRHRLVLRREETQQERGRGRVHDLQRAAA